MKVYIICFVHAQIPYSKNPAPAIWAKTVSANQVIGFLNQLYI